MLAKSYGMSFDSTVTRADGDEAVRLEIERVVRIARECLENEDKDCSLKSAVHMDLPPYILLLCKSSVGAVVFITWQRAVS